MAAQSSPSEYSPERRQEARFVVEVPALLVWGMERYAGTVRNVSSRGLFLTLERRAEELRQDDPVEVVLEEMELTHQATISRVERGAEGDEPVSVAVILHESLDLQAVTDRYLL